MAYTHLRVIMYAPTTTSPAGTREDQINTICDRFRVGWEWTVKERQHHKDTLRVFLAPEWYFSHEHGMYSATDLLKITERLQEFSKGYSDSLFIPGSVRWATTLSPELVKRAGLPQAARSAGSFGRTLRNGFEFVSNTVPIIAGGELVHLYDKRWEAGDFTAPQRQYGFDKNPLGLPPPTGSNTFEYGQIRFGIEVCADHGKGELLNAVGPNPLADRISAGVDVHILISCGAKVLASKTAVRNNGIVCHCDGILAGGANRRGAMFVSKVIYNGTNATFDPTWAAVTTFPLTHRKLIDDVKGEAGRVGVFRWLWRVPHKR